MKQLRPFVFILLALFAIRLLNPWPPTHAAPSTAYPWTHVASSTSATSIVSGPAVLHTFTLNTAGASSVISIFDLSAASCTGTPSTNVYAVFTLPASGVLPGTLLNDARFANGICIQDATAASDQTVVWSQ